MKIYLKSLLLVSLTTLLVACSNLTNSSTLTSSNPLTSSKQSTTSSKKPSSSSKDSSSSGGNVTVQLATSSGLTFNFDAKGARITTVEWGGKRIGKDGFIAGRVANRIANAQFELNGQTWNLEKGSWEKHQLHGGPNMNGWSNDDWTLMDQTANKIIYSLHSPHLDKGYPGAVDITVTYTLSDAGELTIEYDAVTDQDTIINPINHLYMSLNGNNSSANHKLWLNADSYTEKDSELIPTGSILSVEGNKFDFSTEKNIPQNSYDDNYVLNGEGYRKVATMTGTLSGISVDVYTDRPGLQLYNTNTDICLETQNFPDAINHDNFPSPILRKDERFYSKTAYVFTKAE